MNKVLYALFYMGIYAICLPVFSMERVKPAVHTRILMIDAHDEEIPSQKKVKLNVPSPFLSSPHQVLETENIALSPKEVAQANTLIEDRVAHILELSRTNQARHNLEYNPTKTLLDVFTYLETPEETDFAIKKCVEQGAQINSKVEYGKFGPCTALMIAAKKNNLAAVMKLIEMGARLDETDKKGRSAHQIALANRANDVIAYFGELEKSAQLQSAKAIVPMGKPAAPRSPLAEANKTIQNSPGTPEQVPALLPDHNLTTRDAQNLAQAVQQSSTIEIDEMNAMPLIQRAFDYILKKAAEKDISLLRMSFLAARMAAIAALLEAVKKDDREHVCQIIESVGATTLCDSKALLLALELNMLKIAKLLIEKKIGINSQNGLGQTALMLATEKANDHPEFFVMISLLHNAKADPTLKDKNGNIFLDYASLKLMPEMPCWTSEYEHLMKGKKA